jgi:flavin reductase (DIM6/NTAB) family NADH-FMN oxidoreductase RutF
MELDPTSQPWKSTYKLMIGAIVPRPIGWVSTVSAAGQPNLAPFSFFNGVCANPPTVLFCPMIRGTDGATKDTINNIRATEEFVVNIVTESLAGAMNISATELPSAIDEFERAGLTPMPSAAVRAPRVGESPIHFECRLAEIVEIGTEPGGGSVVIGRVLHIHADDRVIFDGDKVDLSALRPVGRLAGRAFCRVTDTFEMVRPPSEIKPKAGRQPPR